MLWLPTVLGTVRLLSTVLGLVSFDSIIIIENQHTCTHSHISNSLSGGCPVLTNPTNGTFGPVSSRLPGSIVTIQCDAGYVTMVTCDGTLLWSPNSETILCGQLTQHIPTTCEFKNLLV